jgi:DsbC/DsbD-like thiol-disulfide interchange protein
VPHPVIYIVDRSGKVQSVHFEEDYSRRPTISSILSGRLPPSDRAARTTVKSPRVTVTTSSSDATVRGGERIRLFVDVSLPPGMHLYAPGVEGYIPVDWTMPASPAYESFDTRYPKGKMMRLEAIKETVPVYEDEVTLAREVVIAQPPKTGAPAALNLQGEFRYQACDATKCYLPETLPLQWQLRFEPHDRTRVPPELRKNVQ